MSTLKTQTNIELLSAKKEHLSNLDQQRQFILRSHTVQCACPSCGKKQNVFEATGVSIQDYDTWTATERKATCINKLCGRQLEYVVPLFATGPGWEWRLVLTNKPETPDAA